MIRIRPAGASDVAVLEHLLALAAAWRVAVNPVAADGLLADPELARHVTGWLQPEDAGVIAEGDTGEPVDGAWYRYFRAAEPGFGFVAPTTPEMSIAVLPGRRGSGVGGSLVDSLVSVARSRGVRHSSLSAVELARAGDDPVAQVAKDLWS